MAVSFHALMDRAVGASDGPAAAELMLERYRSLERQVPIIYAIGVTNFIGLQVATYGALVSPWSPVPLVIMLMLFRTGYWLRNRRREMPPERIRGELVRTLVFAALFSTFFAGWGTWLFETGDHDSRDMILVFGSLTSIGCAYGLSGFPAAAAIPLTVMGMPLAIRAVATGQPGYIGAGITLALVLLLIARLVAVHNTRFRMLIESRWAIDSERARARIAEKIAIAEREKATGLANVDHLTGLANRRAFLRVLEEVCGLWRPEVVVDGASSPDDRVPSPSPPPASGRGDSCLILIDLDRFKPINDIFGHTIGDAVLRLVAERLTLLADEDGVAARLGGDEFAVLLTDIGSDQAAEATGAGICRALGLPYLADGREFALSACAGVAMLAKSEGSASRALLQADAALYQAKESGHGAAALFSDALEQQRQRRIAIEEALRGPDAAGEIVPLFQPIFELANGRLRSIEALARWHHPRLGRVSPAEFVPIAEQIDAIGAISHGLLKRAAHEAASWPDAVHLSFNVSAVQLCAATSARDIIAVIAKAGLAPGRLDVEVTETALLVDFDAARANLDELRAHGVRIVLDDFGAGHASISYLREMRFDAVKLDGALVRGARASESGRRLLKGVIELCAALPVPCVAEHIETKEQLDLLRTLGCRDGQGNLLSPPLSAKMAKRLAEEKAGERGEAERRRGVA